MFNNKSPKCGCGDIKKTHSDISQLKKYTNYRPKVSIEVGIKKFIDWYLKYYKLD